MALYDYPRDKHPNITLTQFQRRAEDLEVGTLAMHWDGTYRDRVRGSKIVPEYWWDSQSHMVTSSRSFAKHLA